MKKVLIRGSIVILLFFIGSIVGYNLINKEEKLKVFSAADVNNKLVDDSLKNSFEPHFVGDFKLINQSGNTVTPKDFEGVIYVANFIFTTCPGICPIMTKNMEKVYQEYYEEPDFKIISHSVTPLQDSVPVLKEYAELHYASLPKWHFVTGDKAHIYNLARKHYFAAIDEGDGGPEDFVHTENFVLVDKEKRIRGFYDGTDPSEINRLIEEIAILLRAYE